MTQEFVECCDNMIRLTGGSAFLCIICRKLLPKINGTFKDLEKRIIELESAAKTAELERMKMRMDMDKMETKTVQVKDKVKEMEKEVETGMEKAKEEVKEEMKEEMKEREEKASNVVVYGLKEAEETDPEKRKEHDKEKMAQLLEEIGVKAEGEIEVKFRAGKKGEANKPRPMIVRVEDDETREKIRKNARRLAQKDGWKSVFVSEDLTFRQREEGRKIEKKLREEAEKKTEDAKKEGKTGGKFVVVGPRGRRRTVWREERREETE